MDKAEKEEELEGANRDLEVRTATQTLWRPDPERRVYDVFALLDGARDRRIYPFVRRPGLLSRCLYDGDLPEEFARSAPYLVSLSRESLSTRRLLEGALGRSWGIFIHSDRGLEALAEHFRGFLQVQDQVGKKLFFRFFDPRVLRAYLPTCTRPELFAFFGPVRRFVLDGDAPDTLEVFSVEQAVLRRKIVQLCPEAP